MSEKAFEVIIGTQYSNPTVAVAVAGMHLQKIADLLDGRKFSSEILNVTVHGESGEDELGVAIDVLFDCADTDYFGYIENRLALSQYTESVETIALQQA